MGIRWQQQFGDTERFAVFLRFENDPDSGSGATREMAASWGAFQLWVRGENLCAHLEDGETLQHVHWYLLPMLEWLATNWQPLLHEEKLPSRNSADDASEALDRSAFPPVVLGEAAATQWEAAWYAWRSRHALQACREGGVFPDVVLRRFRDLIEVSWKETRIAGVPEHTRFLSSRGVERLAPADVARPLFEALEAAVRYLLDEVSQSVRLRALKRAVAGLSEGDIDEQLAWMVGLGCDQTGILRRWSSLKKKLSRLPNAGSALWSDLRGGLVVEGSCQVALMFGSADPTLNEGDVVLLAKHATKRYVSAGSADPPALRKHLVSTPPSLDRREAYEDGYRLALDFLDSGMPAMSKPGPLPIDSILAKLGIQQEDIVLADRDIRAVAMAGLRHRPAILVNTTSPYNQTPAGRAFTKAHELCHILHDRDQAKDLALISGPWAPLAVERRANAFAAMLLMPLPLVRKAIAALPVPDDSAEGVRTIASKFGTSPSATLEHIGNLQQWDDATRDRVRNDLTEPADRGPGVSD